MQDKQEDIEYWAEIFTLFASGLIPEINKEDAYSIILDHLEDPDMTLDEFERLGEYVRYTATIPSSKFTH